MESGIGEHLTRIDAADLLNLLFRDAFSFQHINEGFENVGIPDTAAFIVEFGVPAAVSAEEKVFKIAALDQFLDEFRPGHIKHEMRLLQNVELYVAAQRGKLGKEVYIRLFVRVSNL